MKKIYWYIICGGKLYLPQGKVPCADQCPCTPEAGTIVFGLGIIDGIPARAVACNSISEDLVPLRDAFEFLPEKLYKPALAAAEKVAWDLNSQHCPVCGGRMDPAGFSSKRCCSCGKQQFTVIAPAAIVLIKHKHKALLVRAKTFKGSHYGLVAGFVETGETLEDCVMREVKEEVGLDIQNIRYFGSQPWPYPCGIMIGFTADYAGGKLQIQQEELSHARWFNRHQLPPIPDKMSIARRLIDDYIFETSSSK